MTSRSPPERPRPTVEHHVPLLCRDLVAARSSVGAARDRAVRRRAAPSPRERPRLAERCRLRRLLLGGWLETVGVGRRQDRRPRRAGQRHEGQGQLSVEKIERYLCGSSKIVSRRPGGSAHRCRPWRCSASVVIAAGRDPDLRLSDVVDEAVLAGDPPGPEAAPRLGHSRSSVTTRHYACPMTGGDEAVAARFDAACRATAATVSDRSEPMLWARSGHDGENEAVER